MSIILRYLASAYDFGSAIQRSYKSALLDAMMGTSQNNWPLMSSPPPLLSFKEHYLCIHIEEPELSLDPVTQLRFADELMQIMDSALARGVGASLVFTTHSPYWVTALNTIAKEQKSKFLSWENLGGYLVKNDGTVASIRDNESCLLMTPNMDEASEVLDERFNLALEGDRRDDDKR